MGLIDYDQEILGEIVYQCIRGLSRSSSGKMPGIVFYARAEACLTQHLHIKAGTL